jgi:hypothetical protein
MCYRLHGPTGDGHCGCHALATVVFCALRGGLRRGGHVESTTGTRHLFCCSRFLYSLNVRRLSHHCCRHYHHHCHSAFCLMYSHVVCRRVPQDDLYYGGLNRPLFLPFIPVLKGNCLVHHITEATDYRLQHATNHELYHTPLNAKTSQEMVRIMDSLLGKTSRYQPFYPDPHLSESGCWL